MKTTTRRATAVLGAAMAASAVWAAPAVAAAPAPSRVTVVASDTSVRSGEQFTLHGRFTSLGKEVPNTIIRVATFRNGAWHRLTGAVMSTGRDGRYTMRIVLDMPGQRQLRVVGDPPGEAIAVARAFTTVRVTR